MTPCSRFAALLLPTLPGFAFAEVETVLAEGARLKVSAPSGDVAVTVKAPPLRIHEWNGCSFDSEVYPRHERWFGSLGVHGGLEGSPFWAALLPRLATCKGLNRVVAQEGQIHLPSQASAERWLARYSAPFDTVWSGDGLVAQWIVSPERRQLNVSVWQICIDGRRPSNLPGAHDESLRIDRVAGTGDVRLPCVGVDAKVAIQTERTWWGFWKQADAMEATLASRRPSGPGNDASAAGK